MIGKRTAPEKKKKEEEEDVKTISDEFDGMNIDGVGHGAEEEVVSPPKTKRPNTN
jgi:hypothetical protein